MKTIMLLGADASEVPTIQTAKQMGLRVVVADHNKNAPGFREPGIIPEICSIADRDKILEIAKKHRIDGIVSFVDAGVRQQAYVCRVLGLPGLSEETAVLGTDKTRMRQRLRECKIPIPAFYIVRTRKELQEVVSYFADRCVVKAPDQAGSRGIYLLKNIHDPNEVDYAWQYCSASSGTGELLVEEFMEGPEICVETVSSGGVCYPVQITDQQHKNPPYFTDSGYSQPSMLDAELQARIRQLAIAANTALGNGTGSSCTEMIITKDGPKIVELGLRLAGDFMTTVMVPLSCGVNMSEAVIRIALGESINVTPTLHKASCVRYFMKERIGTIKAITGLEEARHVPGIQLVGTIKKVGDVAGPLRKSSDRLAYVIAQMDTPQEAINSAEEAINMIDFIVE